MGLIFVDGACQMCNGAGILSNDTACPTCNGTGVVGFCKFSEDVEGSLGSYLKRIREQEKLSESDVAHAMGFSTLKYRDFENDTVNPTKEEFAIIAKWLDEHTFHREIYPGLYVKHFKRELEKLDRTSPSKKYLYEIVHFANMDDTGEPLVIYRSLEDNKVYSRPMKEFLSLVDREKYPNVKQLHRFEICRPEDMPLEKSYASLEVAQLRRVREESKIHMRELAEQMGCSTPHVCGIERGKEQPTPEELEFIKKFVRANISNLWKSESGNFDQSMKELDEEMEDDIIPCLLGRVERFQNTCLQLVSELAEATEQHPGYLIEKYGLTDLVVMAMEEDDEDCEEFEENEKDSE